MFEKKNKSKRILAGALVVWLLVQSMGSYIPVFAGGLGNAGVSESVSGNEDVPVDTGMPEGTESVADDTGFAEGETDASPLADGASTQYDLQNYLTAIILANASGELDGNSMIGVRLNFRVPADIAADNKFTYNFKDIYAYDENGNTNGNPAFNLDYFGMTTGKVMLDGREVGTYQLNAATGELEIQYDTDALGPSDVDRTAYFQVSCRLNADAFEEDGGEYELKFTTTPGVSNPKVDIKEKPTLVRDIVAAKSHSDLDLENRTITYTITLTNNGDQPVENLVIHDTFTPIGNVSNEHFKFESLSGGNGNITVQDTQNGFKDFVISSLPPGTTSFSYTCSFDSSLLNGANNGGAYVNNEISAKQEGDDRPVVIHPNRDGTVVNHPFEIRKDIVNKRGSYDQENDIITWTITINSGTDKYDIAGMKLTDILSNDNGITQEIIDKTNIWVEGKNTGKRYPVTVNDDGGFDFTFPTNEGEITDEFQLVYTTKADFAGAESFKNKVTAEKDGEKLDEAEASVGVTHTILNKEAVDYSADQPYIREPGTGDEGDRVTMKWTATVDIPENTSGTLVFTDKLNSLAWKGLDYDYVLNGSQAAVSVSVDGVEVSGYTEETFRSDIWNYSFKLTFDENFVANNQGKTIVITYETTAAMKGETSQTFNNTAHVELGSIKQDDTASRLIKQDGTYIKKGIDAGRNIAGIYEKEHMITWVVSFNTWETEQEKWKDDVEFTDRVYNMKFYGFKDTASHTDKPDRVYVRTNNGQEYEIPIAASARHEQGDGYYDEFTFRLRDAVGIRTYGGTLTDYMEEGGSIWIYYTTIVPNDELEKYNTIKNYKNEITLTGTRVGEDVPIQPQTVYEEGELAQEVLSKECTTPSDARGNTLTYSIVVNPDGLKLGKPEYTKYKVVDKLPDDLVYKNGSLQVQNSSTRGFLTEGTGAGQYEFSMDENNNMILMVPDSTPLILTYEVYMLADAEQTKDYTNSVVIPEPFVERESSSQENSSKQLIVAASGVDGAVFNIEKVNANNLTQHLSGARFRATEYAWNGSAWAASGVEFEGITGADGMLSTSSTSMGNAEDHVGGFVVTKGTPAVNEVGEPVFQNNCYYKIEEIVAPTGYALTKKAYNVVISAFGSEGLSDAAKNALPTDVFLVTSGIPYLFTNTPRNSLTIHKTYWDVVTEGNASTDVKQPTLFGADAAEIKIYAGRRTLEACKNGLGDDLLIPGATDGNGGLLVGSYTSNTTNEANTGDGNTYVLSDIKAGYYTVYESRPGTGYKPPVDDDGKERVYYFAVDSDGKVRWDDAATGVDNAVGEIKNYRTENNFVIHKQYLDWDGNLLDEDTVADLEKAVFHIQQTKDGNGNPVTDATKTNLAAKEDNTYETGDLEPGEYRITEDASDIYDGNENLVITLTVDDARNITCTVLPANKLEGAVTGNGTTAVSATINNQMKNPVNKVIVEKTYTDPAGNRITTGLDALAAATEFKLYQENASGNFVEVTDPDKQISLTVAAGKVSGEIENLPPGSYRISETKTPAQYTAAEDVSFTVNGDYSISYDGDKTQECTMEIDNQGFEGNSCLIKIEKKYLNQDGDDTNSSYSTDFVYSENLNAIKGVTADDLSSLPAGVSGLTTPGSVISRKGVDGESCTYYFKEVSNKEGYQVTEGYLGITLSYSETGGWKLDAENYYDKDGNDAGSLTGVEVTFDPGAADDSEPASISISWDNKANANKLTLTKRYEGPDGTVIAASSLANPASFALERKSGSTWTAVPDKVDATGAKAGQEGTYVIENLNSGDYRLVEAELPGYKEQSEIYFTVGEDYKISNAYILDEGIRKEVTFGASADGYEYTYSVTNVKESNSFTLTKRFLNYSGNVRTDTDAIQDMDQLEFTVVGTLTAGNAAYNATMTPTATSGQYALSNLADGTYTITETGTPDGYIPAGGEIRLTVTDGKIQASYRNGTTGDFTLIGTDNALQVSAYLNNRPAENQITVNKKYMAADGTTEILLANVTTKATFSLYKAPSAGGQYTKQGSLTMTGASYTVKNLEPGYYRIQEEALAGYTPDKEFIAFTVNANYGIVLAGSPDQTGAMMLDAGTVTNTRVGNSFYITKTYKDNSGAVVTTDTAGTPLREGTVFSLYRDSLLGAPAGQMVYSQERSRFEITNLDPGTWYVSETAAPAGFEAASPVRLTVGEDGKITAAYQGNDGLWTAAASANNGLTVGGTLENHALGNQITITKQYYDGTAVVAPSTLTAWAQFKLYRDYGTASQTDVTTRCMTAGSGGRSGVYTFKNMAPGSYTLVEEPMEEFYPAAAGNITFTVGDDNKITSTGLTQADTEGYQWSATVRNNRRHNQITLTKEYYDFADDQIADLASVENYALFRLYKVAGGRETEVTGKITSTAAAGTYIIKDIPSGTYRIKETATGYQTVPDIEFTVDADWNIAFSPTGADVTVDNGGNDAERELTVSNHALNGIRIHKTFYDTEGNAMRGTAIFKLWKVQDGAGFTKGDAVIADDSQSGCNVSAISKEFISDGSGNYSVRDLPEGIYVITEEENPVYATPYEGWYLYFEVNADKKICNAEGCFADGGSDGDENGEHFMMGVIRYLDVADGVSESLMAEVSVSNYRLVDENHFILDKRYLDEKGQEIADAGALVEQTKFVLKDSDGKEISLTYDDTTGKYSVTDLLEGVYTLTEEEAPEGFILAAQIMVRVDADARLHISYTGAAADCRIEGNDTLDGLVTLINREEEKPEDPEESEKPEDPAKPVDPVNPTAPGQTPVPPQPAMPAPGVKTGDDTPLKAMMATALITLILGAGCIGLYLRRRKNR